MARLICESCRQPFDGRPNRRYCSLPCRRRLEMKRRVWDNLTANAERLMGKAAGADPEARARLECQAARFLSLRPTENRP